MLARFMHLIKEFFSRTSDEVAPHIRDVGLDLVHRKVIRYRCGLDTYFPFPPPTILCALYITSMEIAFPANNLNASTEAFLFELTAHVDLGRAVGSLHYRGRAVGFVTTMGVVTTRTDEFTTIPVTRDWKFTSFATITKVADVWCEEVTSNASFAYLCKPRLYLEGSLRTASRSPQRQAYLTM